MLLAGFRQLLTGNGKAGVDLIWGDYKTLSAGEGISVASFYSYTVFQPELFSLAEKECTNHLAKFCLKCKLFKINYFKTIQIV